MKVEVHIPTREEVLASGVAVPIAREGESWSPKGLGSLKDEQGVYVIHHAGRVKYVGKTDGPSMTFGARLRREFQQTASQGRHIYPKLETLKTPPEIKVVFYTARSIRDLVSVTGTAFDDQQRTVIFEAALTQAYGPDFQVRPVGGGTP